MKVGKVLLTGRPNSGKSTLLNNLLGHKVSITSPKPQTTRFPLEAVYEDERGQIIFIDTPGMFGKAEDTLSRTINHNLEAFYKQEEFDLVVYVIDHTRSRDKEENRILGWVRKITKPKILVVNKADIKTPDFWAEYSFYEAEFQPVIQVSALTHFNLNLLMNAIFDLLPIGEKLVDTTNMIQPGLNLDSKLYLSEIIREKVFLLMRKELPYTVQTQVDTIENRNQHTLYIKGRIVTTADRYKVMIIGKNGAMIKEIGILTRKELEAATGKKIFLDLQVDVNPHWQETF